MSISSSWCINSTTHLFPIHNHPSKFTLLKPFTNVTLIPIAKPTNTNLSSSKLGIKCVNANQNYDPTIEDCTEKRIPRWQKLVSNAASLYPVYVSVGGVIACLRPSTFSWFVNKAPFSYSLSLGLIMLSMGLTLQLRDLLNLFKQRPFTVSFPIYIEVLFVFGFFASIFLGLNYISLFIRNCYKFFVGFLIWIWREL